MKKFSFNLQKVLQLRKFREEECKIALGQAIGFLNEIENRIKETAFKHHNAASQRFTSPMQMAVWDNYIIRLEQEAHILEDQAGKAELLVEEKRAEYMEALKDLKAIEKLKEKRQKEYRKDLFDYQMAETDDLTAARLFG
ncbi:MAG: flagellar export protein FliJ [Treponema sp.]|nr:flagellar export protein FliJ [Treponema sp.]